MSLSPLTWLHTALSSWRARADDVDDGTSTAHAYASRKYRHSLAPCEYFNSGLRSLAYHISKQQIRSEAKP